MIYQGYVTLTTYNKKGQIVSRSTHHNNGTESFFNLLYNLLVGGVSNIDVKSLPHFIQMCSVTVSENASTIDYNNQILIEPAGIKNRTVKKFGLNTTLNCASFTFLLDSYNVKNINNRKEWTAESYALVLYPDDVTAGENQLAYIIPTEKLDLRTGYITSIEWQMIFTNETSLTYNTSSTTQSAQIVGLSKGLSLSSSLDQPLDLQDNGNLQIIENNEGEQR